jgi:hypothetical protein
LISGLLEQAVVGEKIQTIDARGKGAGVKLLGHRSGEPGVFLFIGQVLKAVKILANKGIGEVGEKILVQELGFLGVQHQRLAGRNDTARQDASRSMVPFSAQSL